MFKNELNIIRGPSWRTSMVLQTSGVSGMYGFPNYQMDLTSASIWLEFTTVQCSCVGFKLYNPMDLFFFPHWNVFIVNKNIIKSFCDVMN